MILVVAGTYAEAEHWCHAHGRHLRGRNSDARYVDGPADLRGYLPCTRVVFIGNPIDHPAFLPAKDAILFGRLRKYEEEDGEPTEEDT